MESVHSELASLRRRLRLQTLAFFGVMAVGCMAMGGADAVARTAVSFADVWKLQSKNGGGTPTTRLTLTGDVAVSELKLTDANVVLASQSSDPGLTTNGTLWFDSTAQRLKVRASGSWYEAGPSGSSAPAIRELALVRQPGSDLAWTNMPSAVTEFLNTANTRNKFDLTSFTQFRVVCLQTTAGATDAKLRVEYSTNQSTWANLEDTSTTADLAVGAGTGMKVGVFGNIVAAGQGDVYLRVVGLDGNGSADPKWRFLAIQIK